MTSVFFYKFVHLVALGVLIGYTFYSFAAAGETRRQTMLITGIAALLMLVSGMGIMGHRHFAWHAWVWIKIVCWVGLAAMSGFGYRQRALAPRLKLAALGLIAVAVYAVVYKPAF
jgi:hypothetical protein